MSVDDERAARRLLADALLRVEDAGDGRVHYYSDTGGAGEWPRVEDVIRTWARDAAAALGDGAAR